MVVRLNLVYYGRHDTEQDKRILKVRPDYIVGNPPHGLWGEAYGYQTWWLLQNSESYKAADIKIIGYITSGYEGSGSGSGIDKYWYTLEMNKKLITNMAQLDRVNGVFIDECSAFPDRRSREYLKELTDLAHSYGIITWGNVGQANFDPWYFTGGGFDLVHSVEKWHGQALTPVQQEWGHRISITSFGPEYTLEEAVSLTQDAWSKGLAYCYISDTGYNALPSWFEEYGSRLRAHQPKS